VPGGVDLRRRTCFLGREEAVGYRVLPAAFLAPGLALAAVRVGLAAGFFAALAVLGADLAAARAGLAAGFFAGFRATLAALGADLAAGVFADLGAALAALDADLAAARAGLADRFEAAFLAGLGAALGDGFLAMDFPPDGANQLHITMVSRGRPGSRPSRPARRPVRPSAGVDALIA
jgi:hypothetical protein